MEDGRLIEVALTTPEVFPRYLGATSSTHDRVSDRRRGKGVRKVMPETPPTKRLGTCRCTAALLLNTLLLTACSMDSSQVTERAPQVLGTSIGRVDSIDPPVAYWKSDRERGRGTPVDRTTMDSLLMEMAGRLALQEAVLDGLLARTLEQKGITLTTEAIQREQALMTRILSRNETEAIRLLKEIRLREGLGPVRFSALLRRNASLRRLVEEQVDLREEAIFVSWDTLHGPRRSARVLVTPNLTQARDALEMIRSGQDFSEVAAKVSTDESASTGGLLEPVSRLDPSWPTAFRETLWDLQAGALSEPVLVDGDYLVITFIEQLPGDGVGFEEGRAEAQEYLRRAQERILMDTQARKMLDAVEVDVIDSELNRAWIQMLPALRSARSPSSRTTTESESR